MRVCVFCGSSPGNDPAYRASARAFGEGLARAGIGLVYGGGRTGLMGTVADAALAAGGEAIGVIPRALASREIAHDGLTALHVVGSMHERKAMMAELADAFVALPGGVGTFEEYLEIVTWAQLRIHEKPCILVDVGGYYAPLVAMFDRAYDAGFTNDRTRAIVRVAPDVASALAMLGA